MLERLKREVCETSIALFSGTDALSRQGCVSAYDAESKFVVVKPGNIDCSSLRPVDMAVVDLNGYLIEGGMHPSSDILTHIEVYKAFPGIRSIVHTHSMWTTIWAQAGRDIPVYGTTHADYFHGPVPCTRKLNFFETSERYDEGVGKVIVELCSEKYVNEIPAVLLRSHGGFAFADTPRNAMLTAQALEDVAHMAYFTEALGNTTPIDRGLLDRHYFANHDI